MFTCLSKISYCTGGREGGTGAQRALPVPIPLDYAIPVVLSACQSDHALQSYANVYKFEQNPLLHRREGRRHRSTTFSTRMDSPRLRDSSGAIYVSIGLHLTELSEYSYKQAKTATSSVGGKEAAGTAIFTPTDFPRLHDSSGAIHLLVGPHVTELF